MSKQMENLVHMIKKALDGSFPRKMNLASKYRQI